MGSVGRSLAVLTVTGGVLFVWQAIDFPARNDAVREAAPRLDRAPALPEIPLSAASGEASLGALQTAVMPRKPPPTHRANRSAQSAPPTRRATPAQHVSMPPAAPTAEVQSAEGAAAWRSARRCDTDARISGLFYDPIRPERSVVMLRGGEFGGGGAVHVGSRVGDRRLVEVYPHAARFRGRGEACWLGMFNPRSRDKVARERQKAAREDAKRGKRGATRKGAPAAARRPALSS